MQLKKPKGNTSIGVCSDARSQPCGVSSRRRLSGRRSAQPGDNQNEPRDDGVRAAPGHLACLRQCCVWFRFFGVRRTRSCLARTGQCNWPVSAFHLFFKIRRRERLASFTFHSRLVGRRIFCAPSGAKHHALRASLQHSVLKLGMRARTSGNDSPGSAGPPTRPTA